MPTAPSAKSRGKIAAIGPLVRFRHVRSADFAATLDGETNEPVRQGL
jgi:hypothetical protein